MASQVKTQSNIPRSETASVRQAARVKEYVNQQLEKTRKQVKTVDFIASVLLMVASVIGFLIVAALVDAWVWPLSTFGRWVCLGTIGLGCIAYSVIAIAPLFLKRINPDYAAKMIEDAKPSFRNSLMNYVSFRKHPDEIKPAVFDAVSRQAASDLASVPADATVDQSKLIRLGFILIGLTLFAVGYKMLSPKDPLQTVARIFAPPVKIAKPAVVEIDDVEPGDTMIFFGEQLNVTAVVKGRHQPEDVRLVYSTIDGQLTDQAITMTPDGSLNRYRAALSMSGGGIQSSLRYRVEARDGASPDYEVMVRPNPSITVESLVLTPPKYTNLAERTLVGVGDIEAVEGTKVTVHAVANLPIKIAFIELLNEIALPDQPLGNAKAELRYEERFKTIATPIKMKSEGKSAVAQIPVTLNSNRTRPFASHYRIRFVSTDDDRNSRPNVYPIRVIPDFAPEIKIRNPIESESNLPINGMLAIDIVANDLDFEIRSVGLKIDQQGTKLFDRKLQLAPLDGNRRVAAGFQFRPSELGLKVGDQAVFFATASDNRISHSSDQPDPNVSRTPNYSVTITDWDQQAEEENQNEKRDPDSEDSNQPENEKSSDQSEQQQTDAGEPEDSGDKNSDKGQSGDETGDSGSEGGEGGTGSDDPGAQEAGESGESGEGGTGGSGQDQTGSQENQTPPEDGSGSGGSQSKENEGESADSQQNPSQGDQNSSGQNDPSGENGSGSGESNPSGNQPDSQSNGSQNQGEPSSNDSQQPSDETGGQPESNRGANPDSGSMDPAGADGQQDDSLTNGSPETLSENTPDGKRIQELQEFFENESSDTPDDNGNEPDTNPADQSQESGNPSDGGENSGNSASQPQDGGENSGAPEPGEQNLGESNPGDPNNPASQQQDAGQPAGDGSKPDQPKSADDGPDAGDQSEQNNQEENESSSDGQKKGHQGENPGGPDAGQKQTAEDTNNNDAAREQSDKPGMEDATGKQSQDPGGEETNKTGQESGGTDPGDSSSPGNESGNNESTKPGDSGQSKPGESESQSDSQSGENQESENSGGEGQKPGSEQAAGGQPEQSGESGGESGSESTGQSEQGTDQSQGGTAQSPTGKDSANAGGKPGESEGGQGESDPSATGTGGGTGGSASDVLERQQQNIEHAAKATDLVLKKLSEQRYDPDPELLEKMNWTQQDMEKFLKRWEDMKRAAELGSPTAKKKYEKSLQALGLRPKTGRRAVKELDESATGLSEDSAVSRPSPEREPDFNSFLRDLRR